MTAMLQAIGSAFGWLPASYGPEDIRPFYLVARPGFLGGMGSVIDLFSPQVWNYNMYFSPGESDALSVYADWYMVGHDLTKAMQQRALPA